MIRIPVTDVTKLVPSPGLYAVTCAADAFFSRGMILIRDNGPLLPDLFLHLENYESDIPGKRITIFFHKRLEASNRGLSQEKSLTMGKSEMQELIF